MSYKVLVITYLHVDKDRGKVKSLATYMLVLQQVQMYGRGVGTTMLSLH